MPQLSRFVLIPVELSIDISPRASDRHCSGGVPRCEWIESRGSGARACQDTMVDDRCGESRVSSLRA